MGRIAIRARMTYAEYIVSGLWAERRAARLEKDGGRCQGCGSSENLHVHHKTYERLGSELPDDIVTVCEVCHGFIHAEQRRTRKPLAEVTDAALALIRVSGKTEPTTWVSPAHKPPQKLHDWQRYALEGRWDEAAMARRMRP